MGLFSVILAAVASYAFGAVWYMLMAKPWMAAAGLTEDTVNRSNPIPYILAFVMSLIVAGMMRHIFATSVVDSVWEGFVGGFGLGLFIATPWIVTNYGFSNRPLNLTLIDGAYATLGCTIMGVVLMLLA